MSEAIAYIAGMIAMTVVWFINDTSPDTSPYRRGYMDGYKDAMEEYKKKRWLNERVRVVLDDCVFHYVCYVCIC